MVLCNNAASTLVLFLTDVGRLNRVHAGSLQLLQHRPLLNQRQQILRLDLLLVAFMLGLDEVWLRRLAAVAAAVLLSATTSYCGAVIRHAGDDVCGSGIHRLGRRDAPACKSRINTVGVYYYISCTFS